MRLTKKNYHSTAANRKYWSASQVKAFMRCPAAAMYDTEPATSTALMVGAYVDAALTSQKELKQFRVQHPEIINKRTGELKAEYQKADEMIARTKSDRLFREYTRGRKQVFRNGTTRKSS